MKIKRLVFLILSLTVLAAGWAFAEDNVSYLRLTRVSYVTGDVGYQRSSDEDWFAAGINMPLEPGDHLYTGANGRAEIEFEEGSVLRVAANTDIEILALDDDLVQIRMTNGLATLTATKGGDFEIATPAAAFNTDKDGVYRFEVSEDGRTSAIVRKGRLEAANNYFSRHVESGKRIRVNPNAGLPEIMSYSRRDSWDEWTDRRSSDRMASASRRYLPETVYIGASDLDRHGRWIRVSSYGWGWVPYSVGVDWSPYSDGRWVYRTRFGWTWVSHEPWGWLPYHYGRWYYAGGTGWCWLPGDAFTFNFWSPGLVAFYRGDGWVSWGPLGPGDYYDVHHYYYRRGIDARYLTRLQALNTRRQGDFINRNARNAFHTVSIDHFRGVNPGGHNANDRRNIDRPWAQGQLVNNRLDIRPTPSSFRPAPDRHVERRPEPRRNVPVVVRREPPQSAGNRDRFAPINRSGSSPAPPRVNDTRNPSQPQAGARPDNSRRDANREPSAPPSAKRNPSPRQSPPATKPSGRSGSPGRQNYSPVGQTGSTPVENRGTLAARSAGRSDFANRQSSSSAGQTEESTQGENRRTPAARSAGRSEFANRQDSSSAEQSAYSGRQSYSSARQAEATPLENRSASAARNTGRSEFTNRQDYSSAEQSAYSGRQSYSSARQTESTPSENRGASATRSAEQSAYTGRQSYSSRETRVAPQENRTPARSGNQGIGSNSSGAGRSAGQSNPGSSSRSSATRNGQGGHSRR